MFEISLSLIVVAIGLVATLLWLAVRSRERRQLVALIARVEELERTLAPGAIAGQVPTAPETEQPAVESELFSSDALAGWTSHVGRMLAEESDPTGLAEQAVVAVYRRIEDPVRPSDIADELSVSLRTLERGLERSLDCSPSDLILTVKMREARRMLATGRFRVGEIAHHLAFADAAHFSRRYRKFYSCPPSQHVVAAGVN